MAPITPAAWHKPEHRVVTNVISIKENKETMDKTQEILEEFLQVVADEEPGCLFFAMNRDDERFQFVTYEIFKDKEAVKLHLDTPHIKKLFADEDKFDVKRGGNDVHHETLICQIGPRF